LLPPLPAALRTRRLLDFALRDLRRSAVAPHPPTLDEWEQRMYGRLAAMPDQAEPLQRSQLVAALTVGNQVLQLRAISPQLPFRSEFEAAMAALAAADCEASLASLGGFDRRLAALSDTEAGTGLGLHARASILTITEAIRQYPTYFDAGARP
jgi:hypothetical protein